MTTTWDVLTERTLREIEQAPEVYRPTNFWSPGLTELLQNMRDGGLDQFKSWPTATKWFYPTYGNSWSADRIAAIYQSARETYHPGVWKMHLEPALNGSFEARRDFDVANAWWDQRRWPFDLLSFGESRVGRPRQAYPLVPEKPQVTFGRGYVNYLLCLAALSQHVNEPPRSFLEIGGGFGVLGEILLSRDPDTVYVDLDIPPLVTVAAYYLSELFGAERVLVYDDRVADAGQLTPGGSAVLPNYRIEDLRGDYEVFINSFSFQEMEPAVVDRYVEHVAARGVRYAVSLNSRDGKPKSTKQGEWGVIDQVTSDRVVEMFQRRGFTLLGRYDAPFLRSAGQLVVLGR